MCACKGVCGANKASISSGSRMVVCGVGVRGLWLTPCCLQTSSRPMLSEFPASPACLRPFKKYHACVPQAAAVINISCRDYKEEEIAPTEKKVKGLLSAIKTDSNRPRVGASNVGGWEVGRPVRPPRKCVKTDPSAAGSGEAPPCLCFGLVGWLSVLLPGERRRVKMPLPGLTAGA